MNQYPGWRENGLPSRSLRARPRQLEYIECVQFADWLEKRGLIFSHIPNGEDRPHIEKISRQTGRLIRYSPAAIKLQRMGTRAGVSDYFIADRPPKYPEKIGVWYEMKAEHGGNPTEGQLEWLSLMDGFGYATGWGRGFEAAKRFMIELGF